MVGIMQYFSVILNIFNTQKTKNFKDKFDQK